MRRFTALDALRGLAILGMCLSGRIPWDGLPAWMYHAQSPPPTHEVSQTAFGITWVDLVFPFFLFSMGVAIPVALSKRLENESRFRTILGVVARGILLAAFAVIVQHIRPDALSKSLSNSPHWLAIGLFLAVVFAFARWPQNIRLPIAWSLKVLGWAALVMTLAVQVNSGSGWATLQDADVILMVLAHVSITGALVWIFTRNDLVSRLAWIGNVSAMFLASKEGGWVQAIWDWSPAPSLYQLEFQKYLLIVLPGTCCGDLYLHARANNRATAWNQVRLTALALIGITILVIATIGLHSRTLEATATICITLGIVSCWISRHPLSGTEILVAGLVRWGAFATSIGLIAEGLGGGIRKDSPTTISYFFVCVGLAAFALSSIHILAGAWQKWNPLHFLAMTGANPMLGYVAITNLSTSVFVVSGIESFVGSQSLGPWHLTIYAALKTLFVGAVAALGTRLKVFLRT